MKHILDFNKSVNYQNPDFKVIHIELILFDDKDLRISFLEYEIKRKR